MHVDGLTASKGSSRKLVAVTGRNVLSRELDNGTVLRCVGLGVEVSSLLVSASTRPLLRF